MNEDHLVSRFEIGEAEHGALVDILDRVRSEHGARLVFLAESCGRPVALSGDRPDADLDGVASLVASTAAAASRLAALLGERDVNVLFQDGERDVLHMALAGPVVLAVVFQGQPLQGLERLRARLRQRKAVTEIQSLLSSPEPEAEVCPRGRPSDAELDELLQGLNSQS